MRPTEPEQRQLDEAGFVLLAGFMSPALLDELRQTVDRLFAEEGDRAGSEFKPEAGCRRLANLVDKGEVFRGLVTTPRILGLVRHVLGPDIKLSSLNARSVPPGGAGEQPLHADMSAIADERGFWVCNTVWMLDDYTADNGALRVVPGSHRLGVLPRDALADPLAPHPDEVLITSKAGSVVVMNAHLWHGGTANRMEPAAGQEPGETPGARTAVHVFFCRRDKPQQQYQKRLLRPEVQVALPPELRQLLALDDPLNDQLSGEVAVSSGFLR